MQWRDTLHSAAAAKVLCLRPMHDMMLTLWRAALDVSTGTLVSALKTSAFDRSKPTFWILEGLTYYLSLDENRLLFGSMAALSAPGSMFAATMAPQTFVDRARQKGKGLMSFWKWGFTENFAQVCLLCATCMCVAALHMERILPAALFCESYAGSVDTHATRAYTCVCLWSQSSSAWQAKCQITFRPYAQSSCSLLSADRY